MRYFAITLGIIATACLAFIYLNSGGNLGAISFPASIDVFTNPSATDRTNAPSHAEQHSNANDAVEALQAKVGADGSATTSTHDYKLSAVLTTYKAVSTGGEQIIDGTKRYIGSLIASSTVLSAISPKFTTSILDSAGNVLFGLTASSSAVNYFDLTNASANGVPRISPAGSDSNIPFLLQGKGTGQVELGDARLKFPDSDGSNGNVLQTDGTGVLSWVSPSGVSTASTSAANGTSTLSFAVTQGEYIMVWAKGDLTGNADPVTFTLEINGVVRDTVELELGSSAEDQAYTLQALVTATTTGTTNVRVQHTSVSQPLLSNFYSMALII